MNKHKTRIIIGTVIVALAAYTAGALFGVPFTDSGLIVGDVRKASVLSTSQALRTMDNSSVERLRSDKAFRQQVVASMFVLSDRLDVADSLALMTLSATDGVDSLSTINQRLQNMHEKTSGARELFANLFIETDKVLAGGSSDIYEALLNNAANAFFVVNNDIKARFTDLETLSAYAISSHQEEALEATARWIEYGATDALLSTGNNIAVWANIYAAAKANASLTACLPAPDMAQLGKRWQSNMAAQTKATDAKGALAKAKQSLVRQTDDISAFFTLQANGNACSHAETVAQSDKTNIEDAIRELRNQKIGMKERSIKSLLNTI